jgi:hypothetical protein
MLQLIRERKSWHVIYEPNPSASFRRSSNVCEKCGHALGGLLLKSQSGMLRLFD